MLTLVQSEYGREHSAHQWTFIKFYFAFGRWAILCPHCSCRSNHYMDVRKWICNFGRRLPIKWYGVRDAVLFWILFTIPVVIVLSFGRSESIANLVSRKTSNRASSRFDKLRTVHLLIRRIRSSCLPTLRHNHRRIRPTIRVQIPVFSHDGRADYLYIRGFI